MATLMLELSAPLQSWGAESRFVRRDTRMMPTKSGVIGLLAAALGRRRTDPIEDLVALRFGVRQDQQGSLVRDFQTAIDRHSGPKPKSMPLSNRFYVSDAKYLAAFEADRSLLEGLAEAISSPVFPLFLGRRACPPAGRVVLGIKEESLETVLDTAPWLASGWYRKKQPRDVSLLWSRDASAGEVRDETIRDVPRSFDPRSREYGLRDVIHGWTKLANIDGRALRSDDEHDAFALFGGSV